MSVYRRPFRNPTQPQTRRRWVSTHNPVAYSASLSNSVTLSDTLTEHANFPRAISNAVTVSDALTRGVVSFHRVSTDSLTVSGSLTRLDTYGRSLSNSVNLTPVITALRSYGRSLTNAETIVDSAAFVRHFGRLATVSISYTPVLTRTGTTSSRAIANSLNASDNLVRTTVVARTLVLDLPIAFFIEATRNQGTHRAVANSVSFQGSLRLNNFSRSLTTSLSYSPSLVLQRAFRRSAANNLSLVDAITVHRGLSRSIANSLSLSAADLIRGLSYARPLIVSVADSATISRGVSHTRSVANSEAFIAVVTRQTTDARSLTANIAYADAVVAHRIVPRSLTNALAASASIAHSEAQARTLSNTLTYTPVISRIQHNARVSTNSVSLVAALSLSTHRLRAVANSLTATPVGAFHYTSVKAISNSVSASSNLTRGAALHRIWHNQVIYLPDSTFVFVVPISDGRLIIEPDQQLVFTTDDLTNELTAINIEENTVKSDIHERMIQILAEDASAQLQIIEETVILTPLDLARDHFSLTVNAVPEELLLGDEEISLQTTML